MKSQQWKNILDGLDQDIVDHAAKRFADTDSDEDEEYPDDSRAREYRNLSPRKRRGGLIIGIGSVAAAAAVTGVVLINSTVKHIDLQSAAHSAPGAVLKSPGITEEGGSTAPFGSYSYDNGTHFDVADSLEELDRMPGNFSAELLPVFNEYFFGVWSGEGHSITLSEGADSAFGEDYTCTGIVTDSTGCYMGAHGGVQDDLWFVPENDRDKLYIYRSVEFSDGFLVRDGKGGIMCERTEEYDRSGVPTDYTVLGYFGREKLAYDLGMTTDELFSRVELDTYEGSEAGRAHWYRESGGYSSPWDKVLVKEQDPSLILMTMAFTQSDESSRIMYFDLTWTATDAGGWELTNVTKSKDVFARSVYDLKSSLNVSDLDIFESYFRGTWVTYLYEMTLDYSSDIFSGATPCGGFYAGEDGWCMYRLTSPVSSDWASVEVYFIPYDDPTVMYLYETDKLGYASSEGYTLVFTRDDYSSSELDMSHMSWLGLQRFMLDQNYISDDSTFSDAIYAAIADCRNELWSDENYSGSAEEFGGYKIEEYGNGYRFSFQQFDAENNSRWVTVVLRRADNGWEMQPADGITEDISG